MIINFHPKEIESKKGLEIIARLNADGAHKVFHASDKSADEWKQIIKSDEKLVLLSPVFWWGGGYVFEKWIQEVLSYGFAYTYSKEGMPEGQLGGRAFEMHMTHGMPEAMATTMRENIQKRMEQGIFGFCKATITMHFYEAR
ncbi:MAG: NAD(P)H-dependent oxidoreductase [bacterium]